MSLYKPDCWAVLEFSSPTTETIRKVFAGWYGGYAGSDSWKLSSGITKTTEYDNRFEFLNHSGSVYVCHKSAQRMSSYMGTVLAGWLYKSQELDINERFTIKDVSDEYV